MKNITLDFSECKNFRDPYKIIKKEFELPEYYGENPDALWDSLDYFCDYPLMVYIKGLINLPDSIISEMNYIFKVFDDVHKNNPNITFEILEE